MDNSKREEMSVIDAQNTLINARNAGILCNDGQLAEAILRVIIAMKKEDYKLIKLPKLLDKINEMAMQHVGDSDAEIYLKCLEELAAMIESCL